MKYKVSEVKLKNGAEGLLVDVPGVKIMRFNLLFRAGKLFCPADKIELAHVLEHMIFKANKDYRSEQAYTEAIGKNGAYSNAATGGEEILYVADCADFEWERILKLLILGVSQPLILEEQLVTEIEVVREELTRHLNNYGRLLHGEVEKVSLGVDGTVRTSLNCLTNIDARDVKNHYQSTHCAKNMRFVITGDLRGKRAKIKALLDGIDLPADPTSRWAGFRAPFHETDRPISVDHPAANKFYFQFEVVCRPILSLVERVSLRILHELLTGGYFSNRLGSKINGEARRRGLTYGIDSFSANRYGAGVLQFVGHVQAKNAAALFDLIAAEIKKILAGQLSAGEIEAVKRKYLGNHYRQEITSRRLMNHYGTCVTQDELYDYDAPVELLPKINKRLAVGTFQRIFADRHWYFGLLGPEASRHADGFRRQLATVFKA